MATPPPVWRLCACTGLGTTPPTPPLYTLLPAASGEHVLQGALRQRGQRGLDWQTKAVSGRAAGALDILPASNMRSTVSSTAGTLLGSVEISLSYTRWRAQGQQGAPSIAAKRYCLDPCARAASRTSAFSDVAATALCARNLGATAREQKSMPIKAAADREAAAGSGMTHEPDATSAARRGWP